MSKMKQWNVWLGGHIVEVVWYTEDCDATYVTECLLDEGFNADIWVEEE